MDSILKFQRDFFEHGPTRLKPLILRDVAEDIEMHESTISRVNFVPAADRITAQPFQARSAACLYTIRLCRKHRDNRVHVRHTGCE